MEQLYKRVTFNDDFDHTVIINDEPVYLKLVRNIVEISDEQEVVINELNKKPTENGLKPIELKVKELSKLSTAPDKETPDWMESDIRRGIIAGMELSASQNKELRKENELLKVYEKLSNEQADLITQLQSTIDELKEKLKIYETNPR